MKNHITQDEKSQPAAHQSNLDEYPQPGMQRHERFPTKEELNALLGDEVSTAIDAELAVIAYERHLTRIARHHARQDITFLGWSPDISKIPVPVPPILRHAPELPLNAIEAILRLRRRANHRTLDQTARDRFNRALQQAHQAGKYQPLADIHANATTYRMHSMQGSVGTQRFLPWHRKYLLECEKLLRTYEPLVNIPYWDYANDQVRPDWVWQPPNVIRGIPGADPRSPGSLPSQQTVDGIVRNNVAYTSFTYALEHDAHNNVHNWCNGTISVPETAAQDPIFWLLHANVDRIWDRWQLMNNGMPFLNGDDAVLTPWRPTTATDVDSVISLGYWYR